MRIERELLNPIRIGDSPVSITNIIGSKLLKFMRVLKKYDNGQSIERKLKGDQEKIAYCRWQGINKKWVDENWGINIEDKQARLIAKIYRH